MAIRELFHVMHVVDDFDAAHDFYTTLFSPQEVMPKSWSDFDKRWASIGLVGSDFAIEVMEPSKAEADASFPLPKFARRFGEHLHSLAWYVEPGGMPALIEQLRDSGVRVVRPDGSPFGDGPLVDVTKTIFTHGRDTCGQLEFQELGVGPGDARFQPGWSDAFWRDEHPLGIERLSHVTVVVADVVRARDLYARALGARLVYEETGAGTTSAFVLVGTDTMIELAQPLRAESRLGRDLAENGELLTGATFLVRDLDAAQRFVEKLGVRVAERARDSFLLDPADAFGAALGFTSARIPSDPRA